MKSKKLLTAVLCISLGCIMLVATAFASTTGTTGYEAYKSALKATSLAKNFTVNMSADVKDNGSILGNADMQMKMGDTDAQSVSMKGTISADNEQKDFEIYQQSGQSVVKTSDSEIYYVTPNGVMDKRSQSYNMDRDPNAMKAGEAVVDALVGNLKDYFNVTGKADGGSTVDFNISGSQIPAVVNAVTSLCAKENSISREPAVDYTQAGMPPFMKGMHVQAPKLTEDIRVDEISMNAEIDPNNILTRQSMHVTVSGKDAEGVFHQLSVDMDLAFSELGSTTADTVNLEGKQTQTMDYKNLGETPGFRMD